MRCSKPAARQALPAAKQGLDWLMPKQVLDVKGDWAVKRPDVRPGGWAFQYNNAHYPDLDDTAVVVMAMDRARARARRDRHMTTAIARGREWIEGMQSRRRRLGRLRRRQSRILSQQHPVLRPWRAARSADRGRHRALHLDAGPARRDREDQQGGRRRRRLSAPDPTSRGVLVWPLGH